MRKHVLGLLSGAASLALVGSADAQFSNRLADPTTEIAPGDTTVDSISEGEAVLAGAGSPTFTTNTSDVIDFPAVAPSGFGGDDFATESIGVVDITSGSFLTNVSLGINSDDGFRLTVTRPGGTNPMFSSLVLQGDNTQGAGQLGTGANSNQLLAPDPKGPFDVSATLDTLQDGDIITLTFFERGGGENLRFFTGPNGDAGAQQLVGSDASGIDITPIPEPATLGLLAVGGLGLLARRRRA